MLASNPIKEYSGRNSSADDEKERGPPDAFFDLDPVPTGGRRWVRFQAGFHPPLIGPDRFRMP
jgi:hypothetical protein